MSVIRKQYGNYVQNIVKMEQQQRPIRIRITIWNSHQNRYSQVNERCLQISTSNNYVLFIKTGIFWNVIHERKKNTSKIHVQHIQTFKSLNTPNIK